MPPASAVPAAGGTPPVPQPGAAFGMVSLFCYTALLPSPRPLLTRCWFAAPSRCRGAHDAPTAGHVRAADDEAPLWSRHWPWCTGEPCCHMNVLLLSASLESSLCVCIVSAQL